MAIDQGFSIRDHGDSPATARQESHLSHHFIALLRSHKTDGSSDNTGNAAVPDMTLTDDAHHRFSQVIHGREGRSDTVAAIKALAGETISDLIKRLHPQLPAQRLASEIKHLLQYNKAYGNDLGDGSHLDGKNIYLNSMKLYDNQGHVTRIESPTGRATDITYDANGISGYKITSADGTILEQGQKPAGQSGWQVTRGDQTQPLRSVDVDQWGDITVTDADGNKIGHLTRGDDVLTKYSGDTPLESETLRDGQVTTRYQYQMQGGELRVYAMYADHPEQKVLLSDDTSRDAMDLVRCGVGKGDDIAAAAAASYAGDIPSDAYVQSQTAKDNAKIVAKVANELGVDPTVAVATMLVESGGDRFNIGDHGTSFGLFQLHRGGELGNLSPQQAYNPVTNARVALSVFKSNQTKYSNPGQLAAASQRPADPSGYARKVNARLAEAEALLNA